MICHIVVTCQTITTYLRAHPLTLSLHTQSTHSHLQLHTQRCRVKLSAGTDSLACLIFWKQKDIYQIYWHVSLAHFLPTLLLTVMFIQLVIYKWLLLLLSNRLELLECSSFFHQLFVLVNYMLKAILLTHLLDPQSVIANWFHQLDAPSRRTK